MLKIHKYIIRTCLVVLATASLDSAQGKYPDGHFNNVSAFKQVRALGGVLTNSIDPVIQQTSGDPVLVPNESGTTCFSGNAAITPSKTLYVNDIQPVKLNSTNDCVPDKKGATCFRGNVGIMPCKNAEVGNGKLLVNEINPVRFDGTKCVPDDDKGITCFSGDVAIHKNHTLLVNNINPVKTRKNPNTGCIECIPNDACAAATCFSGDIKIRDKHIIGQVDNVTLTEDNSGILKFIFDTTDPNDKSGAYIKVYFVGSGTTDNSTFFDVFFYREFYINLDAPGGTMVVAPGQTLSAAGLIPAIDHFSSVSGPDEVTLALLIESDEGAPVYTGCVHYDIVACHRLLSIECKPRIILN